jgi:hypothetical protein
MPIQVDGAFLRAPCPVPSYPAYEPNPGSVFPSLSTKAYSSRGADIVMQSSNFLGRNHVVFARIFSPFRQRQQNVLAVLDLLAFWHT